MVLASTARRQHMLNRNTEEISVDSVSRRTCISNSRTSLVAYPSKVKGCFMLIMIWLQEILLW